MAKTKTKKAGQPGESVGSRLRNVREERGISLEDAHRSTKMHPRILEALEEDKLENILGETYVKAFLKKYAGYLGLDEEEIVMEYTSRHLDQAKEEPVLKKEPIEGEKKKPGNITAVRIASLALIVVMGFAVIKWISRNKSPVQEQKAVAPKVEEVVKEAVKAEQKTVKKELIPIPAGPIIRLTVSTDREVWLKVSRDGLLIFHGILPRNSKETWLADEEIKLTEIGRPEALSLTVNGKNVDTSGRTIGKNILITHEGIDLAPK